MPTLDERFNFKLELQFQIEFTAHTNKNKLYSGLMGKL